MLKNNSRQCVYPFSYGYKRCKSHTKGSLLCPLHKSKIKVLLIRGGGTILFGVITYFIIHIINPPDQKNHSKKVIYPRDKKILREIDQGCPLLISYHKTYDILKNNRESHDFIKVNLENKSNNSIEDLELKIIFPSSRKVQFICFDGGQTTNFNNVDFQMYQPIYGMYLITEDSLGIQHRIGSPQDAPIYSGAMVLRANRLSKIMYLQFWIEYGGFASSDQGMPIFVEPVGTFPPFLTFEGSFRMPTDSIDYNYDVRVRVEGLDLDS